MSRGIVVGSASYPILFVQLVRFALGGARFREEEPEVQAANPETPPHDHPKRGVAQLSPKGAEDLVASIGP
jgi:hypothetical protein